MRKPVLETIFEEKKSLYANKMFSNNKRRKIKKVGLLKR